MPAANLPTYMFKASLNRDSEYPNSNPFTDTVSASYNGNLGCNKAGSCAPGIGIATGNINFKTDDWKRVADTAPRESQHIGVAGDDLNVIMGTDVNNELAYVDCDVGGAAADAVADAATGAVNKTGGAIVATDWLWGVVPVA